VTAGSAACALLFRVGGIHGSRGARFDFMTGVFWPAALALGCLALLMFVEGLL
jgi:hypothetical protein